MCCNVCGLPDEKWWVVPAVSEGEQEQGKSIDDIISKINNVEFFKLFLKSRV